MSISKRHIRRIVEKSCGSSRIREMDDAIPQIGTSYEDVRELARYHALNGDRDEMLYRDNPDYKDAYDDMAVRESLQKRFMFESRAEKILGLRPNPSPNDVYMAAMNWLSGLKNPERHPDAELVDKVIHNTMVKHQISKRDEHIGSKLNTVRRILDPDLARRQGYRSGIEHEMRRLDPTGEKQKYYYQTPNSLRMAESKMKISKSDLKQIIREEYSKLKRQGLIREGFFKGKHIELQNELLAMAQDRGGAITVNEAYQNSLVIEMGLSIDSTFDILMDMVDSGLLMRTHDYQEQYNLGKEMVAFTVHPDYM